ncbi:DNA mismatch repair protein MSH1, mitochondrial isoform X3 [Mangifera indica]|uniref:DNA mismatch repair protein MSH1, mitochondrial isoform X3 n=1 Tax=Mangifera indica TaxID=29780 RepID=UPI001CFA1BB0|nr:DNA mismatch repair protein MSH1, mitochondrial isoform X3 [Mangifera indica]
MYWLAAKNAVVSFPKFRSISLLLRSPVLNHTPFRPSSLLLRRQFGQIYCFKDWKASRGIKKASKQVRVSNDNALNDKDLSHLMWWQERLQLCRKPSTLHLVKRLKYSNLLGLDVSLKNGSLKEGTLNWEMLQFKSKFPREVLLCRVGDFYESIGIDACILVEFAGLNPFGGLRPESIPKAGCPVMNLRQTLDDLTRNGYSVCIVEEVQGPTQARSRKSRFISGHAHPGNPYVFGLVGIDHDLDFPEPMPVVGISRSARGYCIILVLETMKTYSSEDSLTEDALVTKLRTCRYHHLFLHTSLRQNNSGTCRWGEYGEGGLLWGECNSRHFEWFEGDPILELLFKVKEIYGLENEVTFRNVTVPYENRPRPLYLGTATQIGAVPTEGIPSLLNVLLPSDCTGLPRLYVRDLLLNPPAYEIASTIQAISKLMSNVTCSIPEFTCVSSAKLVKLLELREANHIEFCRIKNVLDEILHMYGNCELNEILKLLMDPTWISTGLKIDFETFVKECKCASIRISEMISLDGESDQKISSYNGIPSDFFEDMECVWKGRVKRIHIEYEIAEVEKAAEALSLAVTEDFLPIVSRIKATTAPLGGPKGEILYAREHEAVWFKGKRFRPAVWAGTPGEEQIKQLKPAIDSKGRKVGEEWFSTMKVEDALMRYHEAGAKAKAKVLELLRGLSSELQIKINILVFASMLLVIAKALFAHVSEGRRRKWVFPTLVRFNNSESIKSSDGANGLKIIGLSPYWFDVAEGSTIHNTVDMQSLFLLTGPNGGGKSSLLRSICAAALLGICGFMVPAESALIPYLDAIMLHMKSYDSPADGKSSFQVEMSEIRSIITGATSRSLVLIDEICRGTETAKGTCIAGGIIEALDNIGCLGIVSTHLHGIFDLPLNTKNTTFKAMGTEYVDGQTKPTWKLIDGICRESLAFETAKKEGVPETIILRAEVLYQLAYAKKNSSERIDTKGRKFCSGTRIGCSDEADLHFSNISVESVHHKIESVMSMEVLQKEIERIVTVMCQRKFVKLTKLKNTSEIAEVQCFAIAAREQPPPSVIGASCVYVMLRPDNKLYVGQTDDLAGRIRTHRSKEGMQTASFLYFKVPGKSVACQIETLLINQLCNQGFTLASIVDGKHRNFGPPDLFMKTVTVH